MEKLQKQYVKILIKMPYITEHAKEKYIQEQRKLDKKVFDVEWEIKELFSKAESEPMHGGLVKRIMDNNYEDAKYYKYKDWRFVICDNTMVTIEKDNFKEKPFYVSKNNKRRKRR